MARKFIRQADGADGGLGRVPESLDGRSVFDMATNCLDRDWPNKNLPPIPYLGSLREVVPVQLAILAIACRQERHALARADKPPAAPERCAN